MVLELLSAVLWYYRNNPANVKRNVDSIQPPALKYRRSEIPSLLTMDSIFVPSGTSFAAIYGGSAILAIRSMQPFVPLVDYLADAGKPNYLNPQLFRWHGAETFHRPRDFSVITLYLIKSKFHRLSELATINAEAAR